jgi:hypothetical protein
MSELVAETMLIVQWRLLEPQLEVLEDLAQLTQRQLERLAAQSSETSTQPAGRRRGASERIPVERVKVTDVPFDASDNRAADEDVAELTRLEPVRRASAPKSTIARRRGVSDAATDSFSPGIGPRPGSTPARLRQR